MLPNNRSARLSGFCDLLDDVERRERDARPERQLERLGEAAQVAAEPEHVDAVPLHDHDHRERHREREVDVRGCGLHRAVSGKKSSQLANRTKMKIVAAIGVTNSAPSSDHLPDEVADVAEQQLEHHLELAGLAGAEA